MPDQPPPESPEHENVEDSQDGTHCQLVAAVEGGVSGELGHHPICCKHYVAGQQDSKDGVGPVQRRHFWGGPEDLDWCHNLFHVTKVGEGWSRGSRLAVRVTSCIASGLVTNMADRSERRSQQFVL